MPGGRAVRKFRGHHLSGVSCSFCNRRFTASDGFVMREAPFFPVCRSALIGCRAKSNGQLSKRCWGPMNQRNTRSGRGARW